MSYIFFSLKISSKVKCLFFCKYIHKLIFFNNLKFYHFQYFLEIISSIFFFKKNTKISIGKNILKIFLEFLNK